MSKKKVSAAAAPGFLLEVLAGALGQVLAGSMQPLLQKICDKAPKRFPAKIKAFYAVLVELRDITDETKTKIDDAAVSSLIDAVMSVAKANGVTL